MKRGRPAGSKNKNPRKQKDAEIKDTPKIAESILKETNDENTDNVENHESKRIMRFLSTTSIIRRYGIEMNRMMLMMLSHILCQVK